MRSFPHAVFCAFVASTVACTPVLGADWSARDQRRLDAICAITLVCAAGVGIAAWAFGGCAAKAPPPAPPSVAELRRLEAQAAEERADAVAKAAARVRVKMSEEDYAKLRSEALKQSDNLEDYVRNLAKKLEADPALEDAWVLELRELCLKEDLDPAKIRIRHVPGLDEGRFVDPIFRAVIVRHTDKELAKAAKLGARSQGIDTAKIAALLPLSILGGPDLFELFSQASVDAGLSTVDRIVLGKKFSWHAGLAGVKARATIKTLWNTGILGNVPKEK